jgi:hypothetical protein
MTIGLFERATPAPTLLVRKPITLSSGNEQLGRPKATCFGLRQRARTREARECLRSPASLSPVAESRSQAWGRRGLPRELSTLSAQTTPSGQATAARQPEPLGCRPDRRRRRWTGRCRCRSSRGPVEPGCAPSSSGTASSRRAAAPRGGISPGAPPPDDSNPRTGRVRATAASPLLTLSVAHMTRRVVGHDVPAFAALGLCPSASQSLRDPGDGLAARAASHSASNGSSLRRSPFRSSVFWRGAGSRSRNSRPKRSTLAAPRRDIKPIPCR